MTTNEKQKLDPQAVLRLVSAASASFDAQLTPEERSAMNDRSAGEGAPAPVYSIDEREAAMLDFELTGAAEALEVLADQIEAVMARRLEEAYRQALEVYYTAEELAKDPEHAALIPHVEAMRRAHESQYGKPIPPRVVSVAR